MSSYDSIEENEMEAKILLKHSTSLTNKGIHLGKDSSSISSALNTVNGNIRTTEVDETPRRRQLFDRERVNLESHQLIIFDKCANIYTLEELRKIINYTKFIDNVDEAVQFIEQAKDTTTFLICSDSFAEIIVPQIHVLKSIRSVYVYCDNTQCHKQWYKDYSKVKEVYTDLQLLLNDLNHDVKQYLQKETHGIFGEFNNEDYTTNIRTFSWWNYVIFMLCHLPYPDNCRQTFLLTLRTYYQGKDIELRALDEFENTYTPVTAIQWYTRDTFVYRLLNKALRQKNMEVIFLFGFFIKDLYSQLKNEYENFKSNNLHNDIVKLYRTQLISMDEIPIFESGSTFINTSFFSTSLDRSLVLFLLHPSSQRDDPLQNILFEIEADVHMISQPFGDISSLSVFTSEREVLFMIGTQFRVIECFYDDESNTHIVKLKLDEEPPIKHNLCFTGMTARMILKLCVTEMLHHLYLVSAEELDMIFAELYELFPSEKEWLNAAKYHCFANFYALYHVKHYPEYINIILSHCEQALNIYHSYLNDNELNCTIDIGRIYIKMGFIYSAYVNDDNLARKHYDLGIASCTASLQTMMNKQNRMDLYNIILWNCESKIAITEDKTQKRIIALDGIKYREQQLQEMLNYLPSEHIDFAECLQSLADLQKSINRVTEAIANYEKLAQIYLSQPKPNLSGSEILFDEISKLYIEQIRDYSLALHYKQKGLECCIKKRAATPDLQIYSISYSNFEAAEKYHELADIYFQLLQYELAYENLMKAKQLYENSDYHSATEKVTLVEEKIENVRQFLSDDYKLKTLITID